MVMQNEIDFELDFGDPEVTGGISVFDPEFDEVFFYDGDDLGVRLFHDRTSFRVWAPTASAAHVVLYTSNTGRPVQEIDMKRSQKGTWVLTVPESLEGYLYTYKVLVGRQFHESIDPYAQAVAVNGDKGAIIDMSKTNPANWKPNVRPPFTRQTDAIIYEVHVRDLTVHPQSGATHKGKFVAAAEHGTTGPNGILTGIDHIASLGVTHVQFLPVFDYSHISVDETEPDGTRYNWGYDPKNYNVPEGYYATDPYTPATRVTELKQMIQGYHDAGLRVIMDVVYNHVADAFRNALGKLVPGYFFRYWDKEGKVLSNGSGCGNDTASDRLMMRKFILDSVKYWATEYMFDGFRFDLMGLHDIETMNQVRALLNRIDPAMVLIGEGWYLNTAMDDAKKANIYNSWQMRSVGQFNDSMRNTLKGNPFEERAQGFVGGGKFLENEVRKGIVGGIPYNEYIHSIVAEPDQNVNYVECHDNHTMWDKLKLTNGHDTRRTRRRMHRLSSAIVLLSQGIAFLHAGQEFMRTKFGCENSYNLPDAINRMDWDRAANHQDDVEYLRRLIMVRRAHSAFRLPSTELIKTHLLFEDSPGHTVAYSLRDNAGGDNCKHIYVLFNANQGSARVTLPPLGDWHVLFGKEHIEDMEDQALEVEGLSTVVLYVK
jgi:pullulanase